LGGFGKAWFYSKSADRSERDGAADAERVSGHDAGSDALSRRQFSAAWVLILPIAKPLHGVLFLGTLADSVEQSVYGLLLNRRVDVGIACFSVQHGDNRLRGIHGDLLATDLLECDGICSSAVHTSSPFRGMGINCVNTNNDITNYQYVLD
jgi:hypothetical protein